MSNSLWPHGLYHTRLPCPSPTPGVYSNSCPSRWWCHPTISSSVVPFSSCLQSFPVSGSFPMSQEAKVLELQLQDSTSNEYSGLISFRIDWLDLLVVQGPLKSLLQHHSSKASIFSAQPSLCSNSHTHTYLLVKPYLWLYGPLSAKSCLRLLIHCTGLS